MKVSQIALLCLLSVNIAVAQVVSTSDEISVDTAIVSVPVVVSDRQGRYVAGLKAEDFTLFRDGKKQNIDFFADDAEPINVALLLDTSPSTATVIGKIKTAALSFVNLLEEEDRAMIVTFDARVREITTLTSNRIELEHAIRGVDIGYEVGTVMRDAVAQTLSGSFGELPGRKAIILLTDAMDFGSKTTEESLLFRLEESDTLVYTVYYKTEIALPANRRGRRNDRRIPQRRRGGIIFPPSRDDSIPVRRRNPMEARQKASRKYLEKMSDITAGRYHDKNIDDLEKTFGSVVDELRKQYRLAFYVPDDSDAGEIHSIKVKVGRKNTSVRSRTTYRSK